MKTYTFSTWDLIEVEYTCTVKAESEEEAIQYIKEGKDDIEWNRTGNEWTVESLIDISLQYTEEDE